MIVDSYVVTNLMDTNLRHIINSKQALSEDHVSTFMYQLPVARRAAAGAAHRKPR